MSNCQFEDIRNIQNARLLVQGHWKFLCQTFDFRDQRECTCTCSEEIFVPIWYSRFVAITFNAMKHVHCDTIVKLKSQEHMSFPA